MARGCAQTPLMSAPQMDDLVSAYAAMRPADGFDPRTNQANPFNASSYHCTFLDTNIGYKRQVQALIERVCLPAISRLVDDYKVLTANIYVKPPGAGLFQIHQNWPTCRNFDETSITVWIPLQDVDARNGGIHIVEGSHKIVPDIASMHCAPYFHEFEAALVERHLKPVPMKAGEALVFCDTLLHWSPTNQSDSPRAAIQIEMVPAETSPVLFWMDRQRPQDGFELFELDSDFFVERSIGDLIDRPPGLKRVGRAANPNRLLTEAEFVQKMAEGPATRAKLYHPRDADGRPLVSRAPEA